LYENSSFDDVRNYFIELGWKVFSIDKDGQPQLGAVELRKGYNLFACGPEHLLYERLPEVPAL
jgi:hypothetical protein